MTCRPTTLATKYANGLDNNDPERLASTVFEFIDLINRERNPAEGFDRTRLVNTTNKFNTLSRRVDLTDYPLSNDRFNQVNNITYVDFADFLNQSGYTFDEAEGIIDNAYNVSRRVVGTGNNANNNNNLFGGTAGTGNNANNLFGGTAGTDNNANNLFGGTAGTGSPTLPWNQYPTTFKGVMDQFEFYNTSNIANSISGGFCGGFGNPFGKLLGIVASIKAGVSLLKKLASFSLADLFSLALSSALDAIKEKLASIVDSLKNLLLNQLNNIIKSATNIVNGSIAIFDDISKRVEDAKSFFKDLTMEKIKDKIRAFVDAAIAQFEELTPEAIALLLFRFCQFAEMIQAFLKAPVDFVKQYFGNIARQTIAVNSLGALQTQRAISAGAMRLTADARRDARKRMMDTLNSRSSNSTNNSDPGPLPDPEVYVNNPEITEDEARELGTMSDDGIPGKFKWAPQVLNMGKSVSDADDDAGWKMINMEVKVKLLRVATRMGRELTVNSGYRSPEYNRRIGGAKRSQHMSGYAIDVSMAGFSSDDIRKFIRLASQEGFMGMSYYSGSNFTHVDIGGRRTWGSNGAHANWVAAHVRDEFRAGASGMSSQQQNA